MPAKSTKHREIHLIPWSDCVGRFVRLEIDELQVSAVLLCGVEHIVLSLPKNSTESEVLQTKLSSVRPGARVGLLRTDKAFHVSQLKPQGDDTY